VIEDGALKGWELRVCDTAIFLERGIDRHLLCERFSENLHTGTRGKRKVGAQIGPPNRVTLKDNVTFKVFA
jgi:hypothetical protein